MTSQPAEGSGPPSAELPVVAGQQASGGPVADHRIRRTRMGGAWVAAAGFAVVLLLLLIFILENGKRVAVTFLGARGHLPLGVALLLAAVLGILLVVVPGTGRIIQLRLTARRHRRVDATAAAGAVGATQAPADQG
jgi:uncharacterized integral membrane protein